MSVAILVPMLGRPHRVEPLLESIAAVTPEPYRVLFCCTPNDSAIGAVRDAGADYIEVPWEGKGDYQRKINAGYRETTEPLLLMAADDLKFHPHWLDRAVSRLGGPVQVVGTNDLGNPRVLRGVHSTHSLVTRSYVDEFGTIDEPGKVLCEEYWHEFCDDEFVETSWYRKAWAFAEDSIVEHLHPAWGKAPMDDLYARNGIRMRQGKRIFQRRRPLWMPNDGP